MNAIRRLLPVSVMLLVLSPVIARAEVCALVPDGLVSWWRGEGDAADRMGLNPGTLLSGTTFATGKVGQAFSFDGVDDSLAIPNGIIPSSSRTFSIQAWINPAIVGDEKRMVFDGGSVGGVYQLGVADGSYFFQVKLSDGTWYAVATTATAGVWRLVTGVRRGTAVEIWIDGSMQSSAGVPDLDLWAVGGSTYNARIGSSNLGATNLEYWSGLIDEVALFNRALSAGEIAAIHAAGSAGMRACAEPAPGPLSWWRAEDDARDAAGGRHGTLVNGAAFAAGKVGRAFDLDGSDDNVDLGPVDLPSTFTVGAWVYPAAAGGMLLSRDDGGTARSYYLALEAGGTLVGSVVSGGGYTQYRSDAAVTTGAWQHVAVSYDGGAAAGGKLKFYVDGENVPAAPLGGYDTGGTPLDVELHARLGIAGDGTTSPLAGRIDEVAVFDRVLSAAEVADLAAAGDAGLCARACAAVSPGPVSWWPADAGDGSDEAGGNFGTMWNETTTVPGRVGRAFSFDGADDFITVPYSADLDITGALTLAAWVRRNPSSTNGCIVGKAGGYQIYTLPDGRVEFGFHDGSIWHLLDSLATLPEGVWVHVAGTLEPSGAMKLFLDGIEDNSAPLSISPAANSNPVSIGGFGADGAFFNGLIDEPMVFGRALAAAEVAALYGAGWRGMCGPSCAPPPEGLVSWWRGEDASDAMGVNHGSLQSGAAIARGRTGSGFFFDGSDDYVQIPGAVGIPTGAQPRTVTAWINSTGYGSNNHQGILAYGGWGNYGGTFFFEYRCGEDRLYLTGYMADLQGNTAVGKNRWRHAAAAYDGSVLRFYLDGQPDGVSTLALATTTAANLMLGNTPLMGDSHGAFMGFVDEVAVYDRALSQAEIAALHAARGTGMCTTKADLALTKTDSSDPVLVGEQFDYLLTVTNDGPDTAESVTLEDTLPAGVGFVAVDNAGCSESGGTVTCALGALPAGGSVTVTVTVSAPATTGTLSNTARVASGTYETDPADDADGEDTLVVKPAASLEPSLGAGFGELEAGLVSAPVEFTLSNTGSGTLAVSSIAIPDSTYSGSFQVAAGGSNPCPSLTPSLAAGAGCTLEATFRPQGAGAMNALLRVQSNDPDHPAVDGDLSGTGLWRLDVAVSPTGGGTVAGTGIACPGDCTQTYASDGASASLTASPAENMRFTGWSGDASGSANPLGLTVDSHHDVTAQFAPNVANPSFEAAALAPWTRVNLAAKDKPVNTAFHSGSWSFKMAGSPVAKTLKQSVWFAGRAGDSLVVKGWSKSRNVSPLGGFFGIKVKVLYAGGTSRTYSIPFAKTSHAWALKQRTIVAEKAYSGLVVSLIYAGQTGTAWFDDITLSRP